MIQNYEDIVRDWYNRLRPIFLARLARSFPRMRFVDAENIYQDTFIAVHENLVKGTVQENTDWPAYIISIGLHLANKALQRNPLNETVEEKVADDLNEIPEDNCTLNDNAEVQSLLGYELSHTPEPCASIIRMFYYSDLSMEEISQELGYKNASTAKAKKSQCMTDLIKRVTDSLKRAGFDVKPKSRNRNGKN